MFVRFIQLYNISFIKRVTRKFHIVVLQQQLQRNVQKKCVHMQSRFFMLIRRIVFFLPFSLPSHSALYDFILVWVDYKDS